ncbi:MULTISPECIES: sigma-E processing peptidase SpoIIGA [Sporosarcina]|uniref:Sigma-E processing peptidase SpoIIGA n=1 Tax=Sporosarcina contaminans TaxID=633403 RepID=A0ABW3TUM2_9BACL
MYGEIIVGINMVFNFAILLFANKICHAQASRGRLLFASFVGALPVTLFSSSFIILFFTFIGMTGIAFGKTIETWKKTSVIVLIGAMFAGGLLTFFINKVTFQDDLFSVFIYASIAYVSLLFLKVKWLDVRKARHLSSYRVSTTLSIWQQEFAVEGFIDTGNSCTEPLTGYPVHFVSYRVVEPYMPEELKGPLQAFDPKGIPDLRSFPETSQKQLRLVKLQTVSGSSWVVGFKFDCWKIDSGDKLQSGYIVLTEQDRRYPEGAEAILHVSALESLKNEGGTVHVA